MSVSNWLKATQRRVKETILQSVGAHDKTDDGHFETSYQSFVTFSRDLAKVHLSMQLWLEAIDLICAASVGVGESLSTFCAGSDVCDKSPLLDISRSFQAISVDFNTVIRTTMRSIFIDRCMKPIESILAVVPVVQDKMQKRKALRLDADFYRSKLASEQSAGKGDDHPSVVKNNNKLNEANKSLNIVTSELLSLINELNAQRHFMLGPELAAMVACMLTFHTSASSQLSQISPLIPQSASTTCLLLATFEAKRALKSPESVTALCEKTAAFPMQPVFQRPGAQGGTAGGYGYTPLIDGAQSSVDTLLRTSRLSSCSTDRGSGTGTEAEWGKPVGDRASMSSGCNPSSDKQMSSSLQQRVLSTKRQPAIKLGMEATPRDSSTYPDDPRTSDSTAPEPQPTSPRIASMACVKRTPLTTASGTGPTRPMSVPASRGAGDSPAFLQAPPLGAPGRGRQKQRASATSNSLRLTAAAAAKSGSPKATLGVVSDGSGWDRRSSGDEDGDNDWRERELREAADIPVTYPVGTAPATIRVTSTLSDESAASIRSDGSTVASGNGTSNSSCKKNVVQDNNIVRALFTYHSDEPGDLCFEKGNRIQVISRDDSGWWQGQLNGKIGVFPSNYVELFEVEEDIVSSITRS